MNEDQLSGGRQSVGHARQYGHTDARIMRYLRQSGWSSEQIEELSRTLAVPLGGAMRPPLPPAPCAARRTVLRGRNALCNMARSRAKMTRAHPPLAVTRREAIMPSNQHRALLAALIAATLCLAAAASAQQLPVTHGNSTYVISYDPATKYLDCASNNTDCVWRTPISTRVASFSSVAAVATPAGPVIVYSEDGAQTYFALPHFRTGALTVENSGEPLRGPIGRGLLLSCIFQQEQYGAKLICRLLEPGAPARMREHKWDVNMWGTHQEPGTSELQEWTTGAAPQSGRMVNADLRLQLDVPQGFRYTPMDETSGALYGPTDGVFMTVFSGDGATPLEELGDAYMAELGVTVAHRSMETLDNGQPALLLMGNGTIEGVPSLHVVLVYSAADRTWVLSYTGRADVGNAYVPAFMEALNSFQPLP